MLNKLFAQADVINTGDFNVPKVSTDGAAEKALKYVFAILGALSVLMIIIGGIRYIVSTGNPQQTTAAKNSIIYAIVGLVISLAAFVIVNFIFDAVEGNVVILQTVAAQL